MVKTGGNPRIHTQEEIITRWGPEKIAEARKRLCESRWLAKKKDK